VHVLSLTRIRESAALFGAVFAVVALIAALAVTMVGFLAQQATDGVQSGLQSRAGADLAFRPSLRVSADPGEQDQQVRDAVVRSFAPTGVDMSVSRSLDKRVKLRIPGDLGVDAEWIGLAASYQDLEQRVEIVDGAFGGGADEVIVQENAAAALDLSPGDQLLIDGAPFTVAGTWRPVDHLDPRWYGEAMISTGLDQNYGPFVIEESAWGRLADDARARWTLVPDISQITAANLSSVVDAWSRIDADWRGQVSHTETLEKQSRFVQTADELGVRVSGLTAIEPVVLLLLAAIAVVSLAELGRLLAATRAGETALIWSRGASAWDVSISTAVEVGIVALLGGAIGAAAGVAALVTVSGGAGVLAWLGPATWAIPLLGVVSAAGLAAFSAYRSAGTLTVRDPGDAGGRVRRLAAPGLVVLVAAAAGLAVWQLRLYGSPVTPTAEGTSAVDPIAVIAPALALMAIVLVAVLAFPLLARLGDRASQRHGVAAHLAARTVARRVSLAAAPLTVVALAVGSTVVAASYSATWTNSFDITSQLRAGADLHISSRIEGIDPETIDRLAGIPGVELTAPLEIQPLSLGGESGSIVAASPDAVARLATTASGAFDPAAAADAIRIDPLTPALPPGADAVELTVALTNFVIPPTIGIRIVDGMGVMRLLPLEATAGDDAATEVYSAELPDVLRSAPGPLRMLSVQFSIDDDAVVGTQFAHLAMQSLTSRAGGTTTEIPWDQYWLPDSTELQFSPPAPDGTGLGFQVYSDTLDVRLTPSFDGTFDDRITPPVLISQQLADAFSVDVGDLITFPLQDGFDRLNAQVAGIVPAIPGAPADTALLMDLAVIQHFQLRTATNLTQPRDVWVAADDPAGVAAAVRPDFPANARVDSADDPAGRQVLGSAAVALWAGAGICGLLALIGVAAAARAQLRSRRGEVAVLRAIGLGTSDQAGIRARELAIILGTGLIVGLIAGGAVALLTVPQLARAAVPRPYDAVGTALAVDALWLAVGVAALAVALCIVVAAASRSVAAQARRAVPSEGAS
jgi:hypothetical protein